jgi:hypothetical protein
MYFGGNEMSELNQLMLEHEEFLEEALDDMEFGGALTDDQVSCIRQACGKQKSKQSYVMPIMQEMFDDFNRVFGGNHGKV